MPSYDCMMAADRAWNGEGPDPGRSAGSGPWRWERRRAMSSVAARGGIGGVVPAQPVHERRQVGVLIDPGELDAGHRGQVGELIAVHVEAEARVVGAAG